MSRESPAGADADSDCASEASLAFTEASTPAAEYSIEELLAEELIDVDDAAGGTIPAKHFLVKWTGYPWYRNSWEPETILREDVPELIQEWEAKQGQPDVLPPFDVADWLERLEKFKAENVRRRRIRNLRREKHGLDPWPYPLTGEAYEPVPDSDPESTATSVTLDYNETASDEPNASLRKRKRPAEAESDSDDNRPLALRRRSNSKAARATETIKATPSKRTQPRSRSQDGPQKARAASTRTVSTSAIETGPTKPALPRKHAGLAAQSGFGPGARTQPNVFTGGTETRQRTRTVVTPRFHPNLRIRNLANKRVDKAPVQIPANLRPIDSPASAVAPSASMASLSARSMAFPHSPTFETPQIPPKYPSLECWYQYNGNVHPTGKICPFSHTRTGFAAGIQNRLEKGQATCNDWWEGKCNRPPAKCRWRHGVARYLIGDDGMPQEWDPEQAERILEKRQATQQHLEPLREARVWPGPPSVYKAKFARGLFMQNRCPLLGCFHHHLKQGCSNGDKCKFSHNYVDWVLGGSRGYYWVGELSNRPAPAWAGTPIPISEEYDKLLLAPKTNEPIKFDAKFDPTPDVPLGCYYLHIAGRCTKPAAVCKFEHGPVDWVKGERDNSFFWVGQLSKQATPKTTKDTSTIHRTDLELKPFEVNTHFVQGPPANERLGCFDHLVLNTCAMGQRCRFLHQLANVDWLNAGRGHQACYGIFYRIGRRSGTEKPPFESAPKTPEQPNDTANTRTTNLLDEIDHSHRFRDSPSPTRCTKGNPSRIPVAPRNASIAHASRDASVTHASRDGSLARQPLTPINTAIPMDAPDTLFMPRTTGDNDLEEQFAPNSATSPSWESAGLVLKVRFPSGNSLEFGMKFDALSHQVQHIHFPELLVHGHRLDLQSTELILADGLRAMLPQYREVLANGDIRTQQQYTKDVASLKYNLSVARAAAIVHRPTCTIIVYPRPHMSNEWAFLDPDAPKDRANLRFAILQPLGNTGNLARVSIPQRWDEAVDRFRLAMSSSQLQQRGVKEGPLRECNVFVLFPPRMDVEQKALVDVLYKGQKCSRLVYTSSTPGAWSAFCHGLHKGIIIIHEAFTAFDKTPGLEDILFKRDGVLIYRLRDSVQPVLSPLAGTAGFNEYETRAYLETIFPGGRAVLILDDVYDGQEDQALDTVHYVCKRIKGLLEQAPLFFKLVGRPELMDWLALRAATEVQTMSDLVGVENIQEDRLVVNKTWTLLDGLVKDDIYSDCFVTPAETELRRDEYEELYHTRRAEALDQMVDWFSQWAKDNAPLFRRFIVVTTIAWASRVRWREMYQHLTILPPHDWLTAEEHSAKNKTLLHKKAAEAAMSADATRQHYSPIEAGPTTSEPQTPASPAERAAAAASHPLVARGSNPNDPRLRARQK